MVDQLPRAMVNDPVIGAFATAFEELADSVRERVDGIEYLVDAGLATPEMLQFLASWLGLMLEPTDPLPYRRALVREAGRLLGWRGTRYGIEGLLSAATGARVTVTDGGGVYGKREEVPPADPVVKVRLDHTGHLTEQQVRALLVAELPLGSRVELEVRYPSRPGRGRARVGPAGAPPDGRGGGPGGGRAGERDGGQGGG